MTRGLRCRIDATPAPSRGAEVRGRRPSSAPRHDEVDAALRHALSSTPLPFGEAKMKLRSSRFGAIAVAVAFVLCAGAGIAQTGGEQRAPRLRIYALGEIDASRYEVVARLWGDSWRSAFRVPTFPDQDQAIAALDAEAARRGADGLVNVSCLDQGRWKWSSNTEPAFLCYGIAIRARPSQG